jgi:hypothetical protein
MPLAPVVDWHTYLKGKWLLWDTCALIRVVEYKATEVFDELAAIGVENVYIHPVQLELLATADQKKAIERAAALAENLTPIPFGNRELEKARDIQLAIGSTSPPSAVDLYVGATLANNNSEKMCLITENIKDFPSPFFTQQCYITLQDVRGSASLAVLTFDKNSL